MEDTLKPEANDDDLRTEAGIRPDGFAEFVGQESLKNNLKVFIQAAKARVARPFHASLSLAHVVAGLPDTAPDLNYTFRVPEYEAALKADAEAKLKALAARLGGEGVKTDYLVGHDIAGGEIVRLALEWGADVIVIGTHGETGLAHALFGSVAERVVRIAGCPVLTVRPPKP